MTRLRSATAALAAAALMAASCGGHGDARDDASTSPTEGGGWWRPDADVTWQWQLAAGADASAPINTSYDVDVYDVDLADTSTGQIERLHGAGRRVVCYFSAGSAEAWRDDADRFTDDDLGAGLEGWPGERWLDVRSANVRAIMGDRLDLAAEKGCDGVEPDNTDGFSNDTGLDVGRADTLAYLRWLADQAHGRGLGIGLKNTLGLVDELADTFDFAVNEQCHDFDECDALQPFRARSKPVLNAEYVEPNTAAAAEAARARVCAQATAAGTTTLILPLELDDSFRVACVP
ncbi:MAG: endo alpha-1,4 polygalactosaminidase [Microthrixaceae bacterium]